MIRLRKATPALVPGERELRAGFLAAVRRTRTGVRLEDLATAVRVGNLTGALETIDWSQFSADSEAALRASLERALQRGANLATSGAPAIAVGIAFDLDSSGARAWIEQHGAARVVDITAETRAAIQQRLLRGFTNQRPPAAIAREIREVIGLTRRGELAVERFAAAQTEAGLQGQALERAVARYRETALKRRAATIARTEVQTALHVGDRAAWDQAIREGRARPDELERIWRASTGSDGGFDEAVCPVCRELNGQVVGYDEAFAAALRATRNAPLRAYVPHHPPAHPNCRCRVVTRPRAAVIAPPPEVRPEPSPVAFLDDWRAAAQRAETTLLEEGVDARALAETVRVTIDPLERTRLIVAFHEEVVKAIRARNAGVLVGRNRGKGVARQLRSAATLRKPAGAAHADEWDAIRDTLHASLWQEPHERIRVRVPIARRDQRAYAVEVTNVISLPGLRYRGGSLWHEFGHHLEYRNERLRARFAAWRAERIAADQAAGRGMVAFFHAPNEPMWEDRFFTPYVGREYRPTVFGYQLNPAMPLRQYQATEAVSMGMEAVGGGRPDRLGPMLATDLEHFFLSVATMLGF